MRQAAVKTKKELNSLLVAERKSMREKAANSKFMQKTLNIFNGMKKRAFEKNEVIDFSLDTFREFVSQRMTICSYCATDLKTSNWTADHETPIARNGGFGLDNINLCCKPCNWQKGKLTGYEFRTLLSDYLPNLPIEASADIKRRLTIGGKWGVRV